MPHDTSKVIRAFIFIPVGVLIFLGARIVIKEAYRYYYDYSNGIYSTLGYSVYRTMPVEVTTSTTTSSKGEVSKNQNGTNKYVNNHYGISFDFPATYHLGDDRLHIC